MRIVITAYRSIAWVESSRGGLSSYQRRDGWSPNVSQHLYIYSPRFLHCSLGVIDINPVLPCYLIFRCNVRNSGVLSWPDVDSGRRVVSAKFTAALSARPTDTQCVYRNNTRLHNWAVTFPKIIRLCIKLMRIISMHCNYCIIDLAPYAR